MKAKLREKERAIVLRKEGRSLGDIANDVGVSKSSISLWVRDSPYTPLVSEEERHKQAGPKISKTKIQKLLEADFGSLTRDSKKKRVILEQENKCLFCGISSWRELPITLAVDHADGNNQNDSRDNLRGLCPNCHSQTDTFCGKDRGTHHKKGQPRVTDERLLCALLETQSMSAALRLVGMSRGSEPFKRCKELLSKHNVNHLVNSQLAVCGFCENEIPNRPYESNQTVFCSRSCAGKKCASVRKTRHSSNG